MHAILAQLDPATFIGSNTAIGIVVAIGAAYLLYRNKDAIKAKIQGGAMTADDTTVAADVVDNIKKGVVTSDAVRGGCSVLCRKMTKVADALPNTESGAAAHQKLRELFVEFGDPTPAVDDPTKV